MCGVRAGGFVRRHVVGEDAPEFEAVSKVEVDDTILGLVGDHGGEIVGRIRVLAALARIAWHPAAENNAFQTTCLAKGPARVVEALADAQPAEFGMDRDLHAIQKIPVRIVACCQTVAGDLSPGMLLQSDFARNHEGRAVSNHLTHVFGDELPLRKICHLCANGFLGKADLFAIDAGTQLGNCPCIAGLSIADEEFRPVRRSRDPRVLGRDGRAVLRFDILRGRRIGIVRHVGSCVIRTAYGSAE